VAAGIACAPVAQADPCTTQACLQKSFADAGGPYIGSGGAHKEGVTVGSDGSGTEISDYGTVTFKMNSVSTDQPITAYGGVVNGGGRISTGAYVTMQLVDGGNGMLFSMGGGDQGFPFCRIVNGSKVNSADCGA
jgi:hypothetical protein